MKPPSVYIKVLIFLILIPLYLNASDFPKKFNNYDKYFSQASKRYNIPVLLLKAIALTENGNFDTKAKSPNKNKTYDYGLMQINTIFLKKYNLTEEQILDPRTNIHLAAKILSDLISSYGYNWESVGKYHSSTSKYKNNWNNKVQKNIVRISKNDPKQKTKPRAILVSVPAEFNSWTKE